MISFFQAILEYPFMRNAILAGLLASVACGVVGTYVVTRRITVIAGSIAHCVLGGMGAAYYLRVVHDVTWLEPLHGAVVAALLAAFVIGWTRVHGHEREDTIISAIWAIGMAVGILFLAKTPGYKADLMTYLFGNINMVSGSELKLLAALDILVLLTASLYYKHLLAICFDEDFARLRGIHVDRFYILLLCLVALTVVTLIYVVGIVLVIALLTLPVSIAGRFFHRLWTIMIASAVLSALFTLLGLALSYGPGLPSGATTILLAGAAYILVNLTRRRWVRGPELPAAKEDIP